MWETSERSNPSEKLRGFQSFVILRPLEGLRGGSAWRNC